MKILVNYDWPGNVRQLENAIEGAVVLSKGNIILPEALSISGITGVGFSEIGKQGNPENGYGKIIEENYSEEGNILSLGDLEEMAILKTLKTFEGNRTKTAEALQISIRTLRNKLNEYRAKGVEID